MKTSRLSRRRCCTMFVLLCCCVVSGKWGNTRSVSKLLFKAEVRPITPVNCTQWCVTVVELPPWCLLPCCGCFLVHRPVAVSPSQRTRVITGYNQSVEMKARFGCICPTRPGRLPPLCCSSCSSTTWATLHNQSVTQTGNTCLWAALGWCRLAEQQSSAASRSRNRLSSLHAMFTSQSGTRAADSTCVCLTGRTMMRTWSAPMASPNARRLCGRDARGGPLRRCSICWQLWSCGWWRAPPSPASTNGYSPCTTSGTRCCCPPCTCSRP